MYGPTTEKVIYVFDSSDSLTFGPFNNVGAVDIRSLSGCEVVEHRAVHEQTVVTVTGPSEVCEGVRFDMHPNNGKIELIFKPVNASRRLRVEVSTPYGITIRR